MMESLITDSSFSPHPTHGCIKQSVSLLKDKCGILADVNNYHAIALTIAIG